MKDFEEKLQDIVRDIESRRSACHRSSVRIMVIYALLVIVVIGYTTFLYGRIKEAVTPDAVSALLVEQLRARLPEAVGELKGQYKPWAKELAVRTVDAGIAMIPQGGEYVRRALDTQSDRFLDYVEQEQMPAVGQALDDAITEAVKNNKQLNAEQFATVFPKIASDTVAQELRKVVDSQFFNGVRDLESQLNVLRTTPNEKLHRRQYSEKMFILYWLALCERGELGVSQDRTITSFVQWLNRSANGLSGKLLEVMR
ncbi:MAG: hypothetical protein PHS41_04765 [Victivallaceae bacterium]|nr:hypothetical protein [Victivallaceae bacterium]